MSEPTPPQGRPSGRNLVPAAVFLAAMVLLGAALGFAYLNAKPGAVAGPGGNGHHTLDSPYQARPFFHGQAQAESNFAVGRAFPRNLSFAYLTKGYLWLSLTDVNANAGVAYLASPLSAPALDFKAIAALHDLDGIQVYNARLARDEPNNADATALWDRLLTAGHRLWGLAGDDTLDSSGPQSTLGRTAVDVQVAEQTPVLIEAALKQGGFVDSTGVRVLGVADDNDTITVVTSDADEVKFIGKGGKVLQTSKGSRGDYHVRWDEGYIRAEATRKSDGAKAWTQPIFVNP
jgi:hypothetical protein